MHVRYPSAPVDFTEFSAVRPLSKTAYQQTCKVVPNDACGYGSFGTLSSSQANMVCPIATTNVKKRSSSTPTLLSNQALRLGQRRGEGALTLDRWAVMSVIKGIRPFAKAQDGVEAPG